MLLIIAYNLSVIICICNRLLNSPPNNNICVFDDLNCLIPLLTAVPINNKREDIAICFPPD